jgi:hypothetical protein
VALHAGGGAEQVAPERRRARVRINQGPQTAQGAGAAALRRAAAAMQRVSCSMLQTAAV